MILDLSEVIQRLGLMKPSKRKIVSATESSCTSCQMASTKPKLQRKKTTTHLSPVQEDQHSMLFTTATTSVLDPPLSNNHIVLLQKVQVPISVPSTTFISRHPFILFNQ
ncbi:hypothetical protein ACF0H5_000093 [Mactra antiquata]